MNLGEMQDGVRVVSIVQLTKSLFGEDWWKKSYMEVTDGIKKWLKENNAHYYGDVREDFFIHKGIQQAKEAGKKIVVVEDLS